MNSAILFTLAVIATIFVALVTYIGGPKKSFNYLKNNLGVTKGIIMFVLFGLILAGGSMISQKVFSDEINWFTYGEVFLGLDHTKNRSPMCEYGDVSDNSTSNGGIRLNMFRSDDKRFEWNSKYTHHSCAFNEDARSYDALGIELNYKFFAR